MKFFDNIRLPNPLFGYHRNSVPRKPPLGFRRSPEWKRVREEFIEENGDKCAVCNLKTNLEVHHIIPLRMDRTRELDKTNLIILCENKSIFCHFVYGHLMNWMSYNKDVIEDAKYLNKKILDRPYS